MVIAPTGSGKRWQLAPRIPDEIQRRLGEYHPVIAQVLYNRKLDDPEKARLFLEGGDAALHDPFDMHGINKAVARIRWAIRRKEKIAVYGDFDADGVTSTVLLTQALAALGAQVEPYIPNRVDEGYGLNIEALRKLARSGVKLVITVDCGIRSVDEVAQARAELKLDIIITDHHSVGDQLPDAFAVIDPKIDARLRLADGKKGGYPEDMLAGVGVAYKLATALYRVYEKQDNFSPQLKLDDLLDLVALGTVADLAPLDRTENRELVRRGLAVLNKAKRPGIYELARVAGVEPGRMNTTTIGFMLGPRINAAGRLGSAMTAYRLLETPDITEASTLAQELQAINSLRQSLTIESVDIARTRALSGAAEALPLIFDAGPEFKPGIVGLVAGRLCEEFYVPAVVVEMGEEESRGSCRSIPEFDITNALDQCADLLVRHGGHTQAAGFTVRNENLPLLRERLMALAQEALRDRQLRPTLAIDAEVPFEYLTMDLAQGLQLLEPCGAGNEAPLLVTWRLRVLECKRVGAEGKHLRLRLSNGLNQIDAIGFKQGDWADHIAPDAYLDVAYHLEVNEWNGRTKLQMNVQDLRLSGVNNGD